MRRGIRAPSRLQRALSEMGERGRRLHGDGVAGIRIGIGMGVMMMSVVEVVS